MVSAHASGHLLYLDVFSHSKLDMNLSQVNFTFIDLDDWPSKERIIIAVIGGLGTFLNSMTLIVFYHHLRKIFSEAGGVFVTNLCVADLLTNIASIIYTFLTYYTHPETSIAALHSILWVTVSVSLLSLTLMALERLLVVIKKAKRWLNKSKASVCCGVVWILSAFCSWILYEDIIIGQLTMVIMFELSVICTIACYIKIYNTVRKIDYTHELPITARYSTRNAEVDIAGMLNMDRNRETQVYRALRREMRLTKTVFILVIILIITVLPCILLMHVILARELSCTFCEHKETTTLAMKILYPLEMLKFAINPIIYAWQLPSFRRMCKKTFICCSTLTEDSRAEFSNPTSFESFTNSPLTAGETGSPSTANPGSPATLNSGSEEIYISTTTIAKLTGRQVSDKEVL